jgi:hypothetical protein
MKQAIENLKMTLKDFGNIEADNKIKSEVKWIENEENRISVLAEIIAFTSEKDAGKNNLSVIYSNYRKLDFFKELYGEDELNFKKDFNTAAKKNNDFTKSYIRYMRWTEIFKKLPEGCYLACTIPNSYWRLIHTDKFKEIISNWDN